MLSHEEDSKMTGVPPPAHSHHYMTGQRPSQGEAMQRGNQERSPPGLRSNSSPYRPGVPVGDQRMMHPRHPVPTVPGPRSNIGQPPPLINLTDKGKIAGSITQGTPLARPMAHHEGSITLGTPRYDASHRQQAPQQTRIEGSITKGTPVAYENSSSNRSVPSTEAPPGHPRMFDPAALQRMPMYDQRMPFQGHAPPMGHQQGHYDRVAMEQMQRYMQPGAPRAFYPAGVHYPGGDHKKYRKFIQNF